MPEIYVFIVQRCFTFKLIFVSFLVLTNIFVDAIKSSIYLATLALDLPSRPTLMRSVPVISYCDARTGRQTALFGASFTISTEITHYFFSVRKKTVFFFVFCTSCYTSYQLNFYWYYYYYYYHYHYHLQVTGCVDI